MSSIERREYHVQGQYGYWVVQEFRPDRDNSGAVYSQIRGIRSRKQAQEIAAALNTAFSQGVSYGARFITHTQD